MEHYLAPLVENGRALITAAGTHYEAPVPSTPGWAVADLVRHIGRVWGLVEVIARTRAASRPAPPKPPPDRAEWLAWAESNLTALLRSLDDLGPDEKVWNWSVLPDTGVFWPRRMCHETLVHRWDVDDAAGSAGAIPAALAADGIDEFFDAFLPMLQGLEPIDGLEGSLHLHATDGAGEWTVMLAPSSFTVTREHAKGDVAVRGTASDLLLWVWNRVPVSALDVFGDATLLDRWARSVRV